MLYLGQSSVNTHSFARIIDEMAARHDRGDWRHFYNHLCIFHVDTDHGIEQDKVEEFSEITWIGWTVVDFKRKKDVSKPTDVTFYRFLDLFFHLPVLARVVTIVNQLLSACAFASGTLT